MPHCCGYHHHHHHCWHPEWDWPEPYPPYPRRYVESPRDDSLRRLEEERDLQERWRIDYQLATPRIAVWAQCAEVYTARRFSDHAPLLIDYDYVC